MGLHVATYTYFPPLHDAYDGGAQRLFGGLITALEHRPDIDRVTMISPPPETRTTRRLPPHTNLHFLRDPVDAAPDGPDAAHADRALVQQLTDQADVIICVDRVFPIATDTPLVLCLNNLSYGPETHAAFAPGWDAAVVPSTTLRNTLIYHGLGSDHWSRPPGPAIHTIAPGLDYQPVTRPPSTPGAIRLCFPHRAEPGKDFTTAATAIHTLTRAGYNVTLDVPEPAGEALWPHQKTHLHQRRELVRHLGIEHLVTFTNWVPHHDMSAYLAQFDACLALSVLPETFGLILTESLSVATPVVATRCDAYLELEHLGAITFVDAHSPDQVSHAILNLPSRAEAHAAAETTRRAFSWATAADQWVTVLHGTRHLPGHREFV